MVQEIIKYALISVSVFAAIMYFVMDYRNRRLQQQLENVQRDILKEELKNIENKDVLEAYEKARSHYEKLKSDNADLLKRLRDS